MDKIKAALCAILAVGIAVGAAAFFSKGAKADRGDIRKVQVWTSELGEEGWLGVRIEDVTSDDLEKYKLKEERGVIVRQVEPDSPADRAGLKAGDVILEYAGIEVLSVRQFMRLVLETPPGRTVRISISRDGHRQDLSVKIGRRTARGFGRIFEVFPDGREFVFRLPDEPPWMWESARPRLGVSVESLTEQLGEFLGVKDGKGVLVTSVEPNSPAARAGLKAGDVIVQVDGRSIESVSDLRRALSDKDERLTLKIIRDKKPMDVAVELEKADKERSRGRKGVRL